MPLNLELAQQVLDQIEAHPEQHDQLQFQNSCGTTYCIGGWAIALGDPDYDWGAGYHGHAPTDAELYDDEPIDPEVRALDLLAGDDTELRAELDQIFYTFDNARALKVFRRIIQESKCRGDHRG